jgi:hypothetical protein
MDWTTSKEFAGNLMPNLSAHAIQFDLNSLSNDPQHSQSNSQAHLIQGGPSSHVMYAGAGNSMLHDPSLNHVQHVNSSGFVSDCSTGNFVQSNAVQYVSGNGSTNAASTGASAYVQMQLNHDPTSQPPQQTAADLQSQDMTVHGHQLHEQLDLDCLINSDAAFYSHDPVPPPQINTNAFLNEPYVSKQSQQQPQQHSQNADRGPQEPYTLPSESSYSNQPPYTISRSDLIDHTMPYANDPHHSQYSHTDRGASSSMQHLPGMATHLVATPNQAALQMSNSYLSAFVDTTSNSQSGVSLRTSSTTSASEMPSCNYVSSASDCFAAPVVVSSCGSNLTSHAQSASNPIELISLDHSNQSFVQQHAQQQTHAQQTKVNSSTYDLPSAATQASNTSQHMTSGHALSIPVELLQAPSNQITLQLVGNEFGGSNDQYVTLEPQPTVIIKGDSNQSIAASNNATSLSFVIANTNQWQPQLANHNHHNQHSQHALHSNDSIVYSMTTASELLPSLGAGFSPLVVTSNGSCNVVKSISQVKISPPPSVISCLQPPRPQPQPITVCSRLDLIEPEVGKVGGVTTRPCIQKITPVILNPPSNKHLAEPSALSESKRLKVVKIEGTSNGSGKPPITVRISLKDSRARVKEDRASKVDKVKVKAEVKETITKGPKCIRKGCKRTALERDDWDNGFCSSECVVIHCRDSFQNWVKSRAPSTSPSARTITAE